MRPLIVRPMNGSSESFFAASAMAAAARADGGIPEGRAPCAAARAEDGTAEGRADDGGGCWDARGDCDGRLSGGGCDGA